jgi:Domain of unknown function (DUF4129)
VPSALAVIGVVLCLSLLEGVWTWLLATASAEVVNQAPPPFLAIALVLSTAWFAARVTAVARVPLDKRRWMLAGGGIALAVAAGTIAAGRLHPLQLVLGTYDPDYRGVGIIVLVLVAYLWGRGLALGSRVNRARILNHIVISASALVLLLLFLPLTLVVRQLGLGAVIVSFLLSLAALLTEQLAGAESRKLTRLQWTSLGTGAGMILVVAGSIFAGVFGQGLVRAGQLLAQVGRLVSPVTDAVLLAAGYLAYYLTLLFSWLAQVFGTDPDAITRAMQQAQERQQRFDQDPTPQSPPEFLVAFVAISLTLIFGVIAIMVFHRLVGRMARDSEDYVTEARIHLKGPGARDRLRSALDWLTGRDGAGGDEDPREAIRRHYRSFQTLMARAQLPRLPSQTPREFEGTVGAALPQTREPVGEVTDAYSLARYAGPKEPIPDPEVVGAAVGRVRQALQESDGSD